MDVIVLVVAVCLLVIIMVVGVLLVVIFNFEPVEYSIRKFAPLKSPLVMFHLL